MRKIYSLLSCRTRYGIFLILSLSFLSACDSDNDNNCQGIDCLPPITQTGAGTFGCLVNGEPFVVSNTSNQVAIYQGGGLLISGAIDDGVTDRYVSIVISEFAIGNTITSGSTYYLVNDSIMKGEYYVRTNDSCNYFTSSTHKGSVTVTNLDTTNFIVSGTFEFDAKSNNCDLEIEITQGRFDLPYIP